MQKITPCLWFNNNADEAVNFYLSIFKNSKRLTTTHYGKESAKASGQSEGAIMTIIFEIEGQRYMALNGGPLFSFTPAISLMANCETQEEIDYFWDKLSEGGRKNQCGWLTDKFGVSWQIVPAVLHDLFKDNDSTSSEKIMREVLKMTKLDIQTLKDAAK